MKGNIIFIRLFSASQNSFYDSKIGRSEIDLFDYVIVLNNISGGKS